MAAPWSRLKPSDQAASNAASPSAVFAPARLRRLTLVSSEHGAMPISRSFADDAADAVQAATGSGGSGRRFPWRPSHGRRALCGTQVAPVCITLQVDFMASKDCQRVAIAQSTHREVQPPRSDHEVRTRRPDRPPRGCDRRRHHHLRGVQRRRRPSANRVAATWSRRTRLGTRPGRRRRPSNRTSRRLRRRCRPKTPGRRRHRRGRSAGGRQTYDGEHPSVVLAPTGAGSG